MRQEPRIEVESVAYHRNGMCGEGIHVVTFKHRVEGERAPRAMVAILFPGRGRVAVFDRKLLGEGIIAFGGIDDGRNSWRGDNFEAPLREGIKSWEKAKDERDALAPIDARD